MQLLYLGSAVIPDGVSSEEWLAHLKPTQETMVPIQLDRVNEKIWRMRCWKTAGFRYGTLAELTAWAETNIPVPVRWQPDTYAKPEDPDMEAVLKDILAGI